MSRNDKRLTQHLASDSSSSDPTRITQLAREAFSKTIWNRMLSKGWTQAELARRSGLGRDVIHSYIGAKSLPNAASAAKLADAFGVSVAQLYPGGGLTLPTDPELPKVQMTPAGANVFLQVNQEVPMRIAVQILTLLQAEVNGQDEAPPTRG